MSQAGDDGFSGDSADSARSDEAAASERGDDSAEPTVDDDGRSDSELQASRTVEEHPEGPREWLHWIRTTDHGVVAFVREVSVSIAAVAVIGLVLFAVSGVWPPMVAVESGSMEPHMNKGDLVFIMDENRMVPDAAHAGTGVVPAHSGETTGYRTFGAYGDVVIYQPNGLQSTPIIHRAMFWVDEGENWHDEADPDAVPSRYDSCESMPNCPAPHGGFITKGDNNQYYDQIGNAPLSGPVKPAWIIGTAEVRIPYLGWIRLQWSALSQGQLRATVDDPGQPMAIEIPEGQSTDDRFVPRSPGAENGTASTAIAVGG